MLQRSIRRPGYSSEERYSLHLSALEVCSRQGAIQIHVYLTLPYPAAAATGDDNDVGDVDDDDDDVRWCR